MVLVYEWRDMSYPWEYSLNPMWRPDDTDSGEPRPVFEEKDMAATYYFLVFTYYMYRKRYKYIYDDILARLTPSGWWWLTAKLVEKTVGYMYLEGI